MTNSTTNADALSGHVIVCGLGHVGYRIVCLLARLGERGVVISHEANDDWVQAIAPSFSVMLGDAREDRRLRDAGIQRAKAVLAVTDDDLANVSIALDARRMNPDVVVTVRLFDQKLAAHFEKSDQINRALSASALAAPAFMAATLGGSVRGAFEADGACWIIEDCMVHDVAKGTTVLEWAKETGCAPIGLERAGDTVIQPAADAPIQPGDRLTVLGPATTVRRTCEGACPCGKGRRRASLRAQLVGLCGWWREVPVGLRIALLALSAIVLLSIGVFRIALGMPLVDALYFVVTTITTVGYGDYSLKEVSPWLKVYGSFLMLCGAAILATLFSIVTDLVLQVRFRDVMTRGAAQWEGHVIVAGLGNVGFRLVRDLVRNGESVVGIECREDGEFVRTVRELIPVVLGNAKMEETLHKAGAAGAKAVIAATDDDLANLSIGLTAKQARPDSRVVLRMFDSTLAEKMERGLGVEAVLSMSAAAAPTFVGSILCPDVLQGLVLRDCLVLVFCRTIRAERPGSGPRSACMGANEAALLVKPAGTSTYQLVTPESRLAEGDRVLGISWRRFQNGRADP